MPGRQSNRVAARISPADALRRLNAAAKLEQVTFLLAAQRILETPRPVNRHVVRPYFERLRHGTMACLARCAPKHVPAEAASGCCSQPRQAQASACLAASAVAAFFFLGARAGMPLGASLGASALLSGLPLVSSTFFSSSTGLTASGSCAADHGRSGVS